MSDRSSAKQDVSAHFSLSRWSRRKLEAAQKDARHPATAGVPPITSASAPTTPTPPRELPPIESLTIDSDFAAFMQPGVDETLRRLALKKLVRDPRFNVMDGLDIYIGDYSQPDPIPPDMLARLTHAKDVLDPSPQRPEQQMPVALTTDATEASGAPADSAAPAPAESVAAPGPNSTGAAADAPSAEASKSSRASI